MPQETKLILLVEDEREIQVLLRRVLTEKSYQVIVAGSTEEGSLVMAEESREIHLLIADIELPQASGFRLMTEYKARYPEGKVIFMSSILPGGLNPPGDEFIPKPFKLSEAVEKIERVLRQSPNGPTDSGDERHNRIG